MKNILALLIALCAIFSVTSCKKDQPAYPPPTPFTKADFPMHIGNTWRYVTYVEGSPKMDTFITVVTDSTVTDSAIYWNCTRYSSQGPSHGYFKVSDSSIDYVPDNFGGLEYSIAIPVSAGGSWQAGRVSYTVPSFLNNYNISGTGYSAYDVYSTTWDAFLSIEVDTHFFLVKGIGIAGEKTTISVSDKVGHMDLIDYHLN